MFIYWFDCDLAYSLILSDYRIGLKHPLLLLLLYNYSNEKQNLSNKISFIFKDGVTFLTQYANEPTFRLLVAPVPHIVFYRNFFLHY